MTDAQTWTLIIGFLAAIAALVGVTTQMTLRVVHAENSSLRTDLTAEIRELRAEMGGRLDQLDGDLQAVVRRLMEG